MDHRRGRTGALTGDAACEPEGPRIKELDMMSGSWPGSSSAARLTLASVTVLVALTLAACGPAAVSPDAAPTASPPAVGSNEPTPEATPLVPAHIVVAQTSRSAVQWPYFVAVDQGFYEDLALEVEFVTAESNTNAIQGLLAGSINIGGGSLSSLIQAVSNGSTNLVVTAAAIDRPNYPLVVASDINDYADLVGKRVGVSRVTSTDGQWMRQILEQNGVNPDSDVEIVEVGGTAQRYQALLSGGVSAVFVTQPVDFQAYREGFKKLGSSTELVEQIIWESFSTTRDWAASDEDALVRFLAAHRRANQWLYDPANRQTAVEILMRETNASEDDAEETYDLWTAERVLAEDSVATPAAVQASLDLEAGNLANPVSVEDILDDSYMDKAAAIVP